MKCVKNNNISACKNFIVEQNDKLYSIITKQVVTKILKVLRKLLSSMNYLIITLLEMFVIPFINQNIAFNRTRQAIFHLIQAIFSVRIAVL